MKTHKSKKKKKAMNSKLIGMKRLIRKKVKLNKFSWM
jgi:hypothetical protein